MSLTYALKYARFQRAHNIALSEPYGPATKAVPTSKYLLKRKNIIGHQSPKTIMGPNSQKEQKTSSALVLTQLVF